MSLRLDYVFDEPLYSDNTLVSENKWGAKFFSIQITQKGATLSRYCVSGRIVDYSFSWVPGGCGIGDRVAFFTDTHKSLDSSLKLVKKDLKRKHVKELVKACQAKFVRSYLNNLLEALR